MALILCLPALIPAFRPGWFEGHDDLHLYRLTEYDLALRDGQIPPRWFPDVSAGYGGPHPIYYAPLFYYVAEVFRLAGFGPVLSLKAAIAIFMLMASAAMYLYARTFLGNWGGVVAAAAYTYAPYHLLDLYVRKAFSEYTVFAFLPLLLLAFRNLKVRGSRWDVISSALAVAGISTSHTISTMMVPALLGAYGLFLSLRSIGGRYLLEWKWIGRAALACAVGYAIAGFFLVPAFLERGLINLDIYTKGYVDFHKHFVYPIQLVWWPWGFGMSLEGLKDQMSFRMGLMQIAGTLLVAFGVARLRTRRPDSVRHAWFFLGMTAVAVFMMIPASGFVWSLFGPLAFVQFPWRFLTFTTLSTGFLCGAAWVAWGPAPVRHAGAGAGVPGLAGAAVICGVFAIAAALSGTLGVNLRAPLDRVGFEEKPYNNMIRLPEPATPSVDLMDGAYVRKHTMRWLDHLPQGVSFMGLDARDFERPRAEVARGTATLSDSHGTHRQRAVPRGRRGRVAHPGQYLPVPRLGGPGRRRARRPRQRITQPSRPVFQSHSRDARCVRDVRENAGPPPRRRPHPRRAGGPGSARGPAVA